MKLVINEQDYLKDPKTGEVFYEVDPQADLKGVLKIDKYLQKRIGYSIDETLSELHSISKDWEDSDDKFERQDYEIYRGMMDHLAKGVYVIDELKDICEILS